MDWNALSERFAVEPAFRSEAVKVARTKLKTVSPSDWQWLATALEDGTTKWFVAAIFRGYPVPKRLFDAFLHTAVYEADPDGNRQFVLPCVKSFGHRKVNEHLLDYVEGDNNHEIAGAVAALYWGNMQIRFNGDVPEFTLEHATPESRSAYLALKDVWERRRNTFLRVFVSNDDVTVRQQIIPSLKLDESVYPDELKPLVVQAIEIARSHPDDYIRHRVECQLGNQRLFKPIPPRSNYG